MTRPEYSKGRKASPTYLADLVGANAGLASAVTGYPPFVGVVSASLANTSVSDFLGISTSLGRSLDIVAQTSAAERLHIENWVSAGTQEAARRFAGVQAAVAPPKMSTALEGTLAMMSPANVDALSAFTSTFGLSADSNLFPAYASPRALQGMIGIGVGAARADAFGKLWGIGPAAERELPWLQRSMKSVLEPVNGAPWGGGATATREHGMSGEDILGRHGPDPSLVKIVAEEVMNLLPRLRLPSREAESLWNSRVSLLLAALAFVLTEDQRRVSLEVVVAVVAHAIAAGGGALVPW
ncbi:hypothetical protein [Nocardiopsis chromatogenes]|uniref:hypothetical protein n=1 Tax=Nocardiopsis chromatogenes TaxID=280239 RepID=UPI00059453F2|nr:hypothetical protein [Nocardiopsis chromatogenes]